MDAHHIEPTLRDGLRETLDAEHGPHPVWAGSPAARRVAERQQRRWPLQTAAAAAAVLVVAIGASQLLPWGLGSGGATATPSPSPTLLARGDFVTVRGAVELEATGQGSNVTGRMTVSGDGWFFTVDLECARTTEDGLIMIGGRTTEADFSGSGLSPVGTLAAVVIQRGSPVQATVWSQRGGGTSAPDCPAYLDERFDEKLMDGRLDDDDPGPIEGTIELGAYAAAPSEAPAAADPSSSGDDSLPVGPHVMGGRLHGEDRVTVTIPAPGWFARDAGSVTKALGGDDRVTVEVVPGDYYTMPRSICDWQIGDADLRDNYWPDTADEFVAYLAEQTYDARDGSPTRDFRAPEDITIDGSHGQRIMDAVAAYPDSDRVACDEQRFCTLQDRDSWGCLLSHREPGALDTLWVVDQPEDRNYLLVVASSGSPSTALRDEVNTLVNSMTFYVE